MYSSHVQCLILLHPKTTLNLQTAKLIFCYFYFRLCLKKDDALDILVEPLEKQASAVRPDERTLRRKSTLGLLTEDEGLHTIKGPGYHTVSTPKRQDIEHNDQSKFARKRSSRKERWQSVRQRTTERKLSAEMQMKQVYNLAKELQENRTKKKESHVRSSSFTVAKTSPKTTKRSFSCGDTDSVRNDFELTGAIPRNEQEDITNDVQDTKV